MTILKAGEIYDKYNQVFTFKGHLSRSDYIYTVIFYCLYFILNAYIWIIDSPLPNITFIENNLILSNLADLLFFILFVTYLFLFIAVNIYFLCRSIQRLHDINESGIWIIFRIFWIFGLIHPIPLILAIICEIILLLKKGTKRPNKYDWLSDAGSFAGKE